MALAGWIPQGIAAQGLDEEAGRAKLGYMISL
jgi:hypothetical protein